mmetsp:Transcript_73286/g.221964  ORF Transcript_73286/g.221964 Transcript_73286/m.221964 type:complete len:212 (+) Transcript_73286:363-998(+)
MVQGVVLTAQLQVGLRRGRHRQGGGRMPRAQNGRQRYGLQDGRDHGRLQRGDFLAPVRDSRHQRARRLSGVRHDGQNSWGHLPRGLYRILPEGRNLSHCARPRCWPSGCPGVGRAGEQQAGQREARKCRKSCCRHQAPRATSRAGAAGHSSVALAEEPGLVTRLAVAVGPGAGASPRAPELPHGVATAAGAPRHGPFGLRLPAAGLACAEA